MAVASIGNKPYSDIKTSDSSFNRTFEENVESDDLIWHRDKKYRIVEVTECGEGWQFQFDNELPIDIRTGTRINIPAEEFHRVIKGQGHLKIKVIELDENV